MWQKKLIDDGVRQGSMLERSLFNTVPTDLFLDCEDDDIDGQVKISEITEITETTEITEKAVEQSNCIIYHWK